MGQEYKWKCVLLYTNYIHPDWCAGGSWFTLVHKSFGKYSTLVNWMCRKLSAFDWEAKPFNFQTCFFVSRRNPKMLHTWNFWSFLSRKEGQGACQQLSIVLTLQVLSLSLSLSPQRQNKMLWWWSFKKKEKGERALGSWGPTARHFVSNLAPTTHQGTMHWKSARTQLCGWTPTELTIGFQVGNLSCKHRSCWYLGS